MEIFEGILDKSNHKILTSYHAQVFPIDRFPVILL